VDLIASEDALMLNSGVMFVRNSRAALRLLRRVYGDASPEAQGAARDGGAPSAAALAEVEDAPVTQADCTAAVAAMLAAGTSGTVSHPRLWEQAALLHEMAGRGVLLPAHAAGLTDVHTNGAGVAGAEPGSGNVTASAPCFVMGDSLLPMTEAAQPSAPAATSGAYTAASRSQFVPQAWLNSYPPALAGKLAGPGGAPLHAAYSPGDWVVSFSGCGVLLGEPTCERLYSEYAAAAAAGLQSASAVPAA
jgi:hypothetical protein